MQTLCSILVYKYMYIHYTCNTPVLVQLVGKGVDHLFTGQFLEEGNIPVLGTDEL